MPKDIRCPSKKRYRPDGFLLTSSSPKKHLSISEAAPDTSSDSARSSAIPLERLSDSGRGSSLWNSASAVVTSDCSAIASVSNSPISADVVSSKHAHLVGTHWQAPSDAASYNVEALQSARGLPFEASKNACRMYCTSDSNCEDTTSDSEYSGVTFAREREAKGGFDLGKATHIISKREKSSLIPKWDMAAVWAENSFWLDAQLRQKQREGNDALLNMRENRGFMSMARESGSFCSTNDSFVKDIRHGFPQTYGSIDTQSFAASLDPHGRVAGFSGQPDKRKTSGSFGYLNPRHSTSAVELKSSFLNQGKVDDVGPSYVLSSGRRSLEEEAKMGQCSSTIDHDFEEYFSSLMLE